MRLTVCSKELCHLKVEVYLGNADVSIHPDGKSSISVPKDYTKYIDEINKMFGEIFALSENCPDYTSWLYDIKPNDKVSLLFK